LPAQSPELLPVFFSLSPGDTIGFSEFNKVRSAEHGGHVLLLVKSSCHCLTIQVAIINDGDFEFNFPLERLLLIVKGHLETAIPRDAPDHIVRAATLARWPLEVQTPLLPVHPK